MIKFFLKLNLFCLLTAIGLFSFNSTSYALNTRLNPSSKPISGEIPVGVCTSVYKGVVRFSPTTHCNYCPDKGYNLAQDTSSNDVCLLDFRGSLPCSEQYPVQEKDQLGKDICVKSETIQTEISVGQKISEYKLSIKIPCAEGIGGGTCPDAQTGIAEYVARIYQFGLMIVGLLALGGLVYGALKYVLSAGNIGTQQDAKDQMLAAIYGLLILLGAFLILYTINPELVKLTNPGAAKIIAVPPAGSTTGGTPGTQQNVLTPGAEQTQNQPAGQLPASPTANPSTQTGCINNSNQYRVVINGKDYWACYGCNNQYNNIDGKCTPK